MGFVNYYGDQYPIMRIAGGLSAMTIGERFFDLLHQRGKTQKEFCESTGIAQQTVSNWKRRNTDPPASLLSKIAYYLNVSPQYLLTGEDVPEDGFIVTDPAAIQLVRYFSSLSTIRKAILLGKAAELYQQTLDDPHSGTDDPQFEEWKL